MTWEYRGLKGATGCYRGLQGFTRGYKELRGGYKVLQGVTRGDKALQGVTKYYRNSFLTRTFPDTFSWSIFHKKLKKSKVFDQSHGLTPKEKF